MNNMKKILKSKRFLMTLFMVIAWLLFGVLGIIYGANMSEFSAYFVALSPFIIGYIYGETKRASGSKFICDKTDCNCKCELE